MHKSLYLIFFFIYSPLYLSAQSAPDTADFPYWIEMMQNRKVNLHQTQRAFEMYWQNRPIDKASGYKPFKRWEYMAQHEADPNGNLPDYQDLYDAIYRYYDSLSGNTYSLTFGSAPCLTSGNWVEIGPQKIPGNRTSQPNGMGRVNALAFHPTDSNIFWAGAPAGGLWKTTNSGNTWTSNTDTLPTLGVSAIAIHPKNPDIIYIGTGDRDASDAYSRGVMKSTDGGNAWKWANSTMGNATIARLIMDQDRPDTLLAATSSGIYRTVNGGTTWTQVNSTGFFKDIVFKPGTTDTVYASRGGTFYRSVNNGVSWTQITSGIPSGTARGAIAVSADKPEFVYLILTNSATFNSLCLSTDGGSTFKVMSTTPNIMDYSSTGSGTGGQAWYDLDIAADPYNASVIYVGGVNIFKSTDSGATWKINAHWVGTGADDIHADQHVLEYSTSGHGLYAGNDGGVYGTFNGGTTWTDISQGLGIAQIYRISQSATTKDYVLNGYQDNGTGLYDNGNWYTVMGGDGMDCAIDPVDPTWGYSDLYYGDVRRYKNGFSNGQIAANGVKGINESGAWITPFILQEGKPSTMFIGYKNVWRSTNVNAATTASITWTKISNNLGGSNSQNIDHLESVITDPEVLYVSRYDNKLFKTTNASAGTPTWTDLTANLPVAAKVDWIESHPKIANRVFIILNNKVYQSDDAGSTWSNISTGLPAIPLLSLVVDSSSKKQGMYLGTYTGVFYKDTTMSSWIWYNKGMPINTRVMDVEVYYHPAGRSQSHVICGTYGRGNWRSPLYDEDQKKPLAGFDSDVKKLCSGQTVSFKDTSLYLPTVWWWDISPKTYSFTGGTDSSSQFPIIRFNQKGKYTVKLYAENCAGVDSVTFTDFIDAGDPITPVNCPGVTKNTSTNYGMGIFYFNTDTFTHNSMGTFEEGGYLDLACNAIFSLKNDTTYNFTIKTGNTYNENVKIFIDFNNNGNLNDAGELVYSGPKQKPTHTGSIAIPKTAVTNTLIRCRVMSDYDTVLHACDTLTYGQTQDYGLILIPRLPTPYFYANTDSLCKSNKVTFTDTSQGNVTDWYWDFGSDAMPATATGKGPHTVAYTTSGPKNIILSLNGGAVSLTKNAYVYVKNAPDIHLKQNSGLSVFCEGAAFGLSLTDSAFLNGNIYWYRNGTLLSTSKAVNSSYFRNPTVQTDSGSYYVVKEYNGCYDTSLQVPITIYPMPKIKPASSKDSLCLYSSNFGFNANATVAWGKLSYSWSFGDAATDTLAVTSHNYTDIGTFTVKLITTTPYACKAEDSIKIVVMPTPVAQFNTPALSQCFKGHQFAFNNTSYIGFGNLRYQWLFGDGQQDTAKNPKHSYALPNSYRVKLIAFSSFSCTDTASVDVEVLPNPSAAFSISANNLCFKDNLFTANDNSTITSGSVASLSWDFGDGNTGGNITPVSHQYNITGNFNWQLIAISDKGCRDTAIKPVTVNPNAVAGLLITDTAQCLNENSFYLQLNNSSDVTAYNLNFSETPAEIPAGSSRYTFPTPGTKTVTLTVTNAGGCGDTLIRLLTVLPSPVADFTVNDICLGDTAYFTGNNATGSSLWQFGDGSVSNLVNPPHVYKNTGSFDVSLIVTDPNGCRDTLTKNGALNVFARPIASFSIDLEALAGLITNVKLQNNSTNASSFQWYFDRFGNSTLSNPQFQVTDTATIQILLIAANTFGCADSAWQTISVIPQLELWVPDVFTPNGDNLNDKFKPAGVRFADDYMLRIYNRWGELLFETNNSNDGWDGTYKGTAVQPGVYIYTISFINSANERKEGRGTIHLIR